MKRVQFEDKKVIIYGDERFVRDFLYIFDDLSPAYIVDDEPSAFARPWSEISSENRNEIFVILCKYNKDKAIQNLESLQLVRNEHFCDADILFAELDFPIERISAERNIYIWGTGDNGHEFFHDFVESHPRMRIKGCVDNNKEKQSMAFWGYTVYDPQAAINDSNAFFIIASKKYYAEIEKRLKESGRKIEEDYITYLALNNDASKMMRKTIYDVPKTDYICPKLFYQAELKPEGRLLICGGMPYLLEKGIPLYYSDWDKVWNSNVMKVARLAAINGTYSFCNAQACEYLYDSENQDFDTHEIHFTFCKSQDEFDYTNTKKKVEKNTVYHASAYNMKANEYPDVFQCGWDESCNLHCPSCRECVYMAPDEKAEELERYTERMKRIFMDHAKRVKIAGLGEAFASKYYRKLLYDEELALSVGSLGILSNGLLATPENMDRVISLWKEVNVFISMDGATKETAEKLRAGINFDKWKQNMEYIGKLKRQGKINKLAFNFVVQKDNYLEMPAFAEMCLGFSADFVKFSKVFNWGNWTQEEFDKISMFDEIGKRKPELEKVISENVVLSRSEIRLFRWIEW